MENVVAVFECLCYNLQQQVFLWRITYESIFCRRVFLVRNADL